MLSVVPTVYAATTAQTLAPVLNPIVKNIVNPIIIVAFALAVTVFVYGVIKMVTNEVDSDAHSQGRISMLSGLVGLFIMISAWGIVNLVFNTVQSFR